MPTCPGPLSGPALTSSTWAWVCCSLLLLVRLGGGAGGPPSPAGAAGGTVAAVADLRSGEGLRPRGQGSAHPPVPRPALPSSCPPDGSPAPCPAPRRRVTLSEAPSSPPPSLSFPACQNNTSDRGGAGQGRRRVRILPRGHRPEPRGSPAGRAVTGGRPAECPSLGPRAEAGQRAVLAVGRPTHMAEASGRRTWQRQ